MCLFEFSSFQFTSLLCIQIWIAILYPVFYQIQDVGILNSILKVAQLLKGLLKV